MLGINFQQILLHLFNFAVLALALNFLLYQPIVDFVKKREQYYKDLEEEANKNILESENILKINNEKLQNIHKESEQIKIEKLKEADTIAKREIELAKEEAQKILVNSREQAEREKETLLRNTKKELKQIVVEAASKLAFSKDAYDDFINHIDGDRNE